MKELKEYVFAQYIGQKVLRYNYAGENNELTFLNDIGWALMNNGKIELRPISSITDDEAIEVAKMYNWMDRIAYRNDVIINQWQLFSITKIYFWFQQSGFSLPIYHHGTQYTVEELVKLKIVKIR